MVEEFLRGRTGIGPRQFRRGEFRIEGDGFVKVLDRVLGLKFFGEVASQPEFLSRVFGLGRDGNFAASRSRRRSLSVRFVARAPHCRAPNEQSKHQAVETVSAHRATPDEFCDEVTYPSCGGSHIDLQVVTSTLRISTDALLLLDADWVSLGSKGMDVC